MGDWGRNGTQNQQEVANQMNRTALNENVDFIISTGDNFLRFCISSRGLYLLIQFFVNQYLQNPNGFNDLVYKTQKSINSVLTNSTETWKIVIGHHPIYSGGFGHGNKEELINQLKPILEKNKVQMYFCGHSHSSQYIKRSDSFHPLCSSWCGFLQLLSLFLKLMRCILAQRAPSFSLVSLSKHKPFNIIYRYIG